MVAAARRAVPEFPRHHPAGRDGHFGDRMAAAGSARERAALRGHRHPGDRRAERHARLFPGGAGGALGARPDGPCGSRIDGDPRRRAPAHPGSRHRAGRHRAGGSRRQDSGGRPDRRKRQSPRRRGSPDRRERAGDEGDAADRRRCRPRRPPQHAVREHGRDLWPWPRRDHRHRHGDGGRPHRRSAGSRREGTDAAAAGTRPHRQAPQRHHARHLRRGVRDRAAQQSRC